MQTALALPSLSAQWDTGWMIAMICLIVISAAGWLCVIGGGIGAIVTRHNSNNGGLYIAIVGLIVALISGLSGTFVAWPFSGQYHRFVPETGTVSQISSRLIASGTSGGGSDQKFVMTFGPGQPAMGLNETRASLIKVGDTVGLLCKRAYQWNAPNQGYDCNIVYVVRNGQRIV